MRPAATIEQVRTRLERPTLPTHQTYDVIILGAGAAGLFCAAEAGRRGRRVLLLDHADRVGKKILISGGGRSNFTNLGCTHENFLSANPQFARSALARFTPQDMVALVERHGIPYHEKTLGQLFCDRTSRDLVTLLERECAEAGVRIQLETHITAVASTSPGFRIESSAGTFLSTSLVVATGGLSIPKMGATGFGYELARQFGLALVEPRPALVPFTLAPADLSTWGDLAGVSAEAVVSTKAAGVSTLKTAAKPNFRTTKPAFREKILITHRGLSGPAILQVSSYWQPGQPVLLDLAPGRDPLAPLRAPNARRDNAALAAILRTLLPSRWAERWLAVHAPAPTQAFPNAALDRFEALLHAWTLTPAGTEGYAKAEVTAGGVSTDELDPRTLAARKVPGLFFIGEVVDVTGWLGGYNFQWAWASAHTAAQAV